MSSSFREKLCIILSHRRRRRKGRKAKEWTRTRRTRRGRSLHHDPHILSLYLLLHRNAHLFAVPTPLLHFLFSFSFLFLLLLIFFFLSFSFSYVYVSCIFSSISFTTILFSFIFPFTPSIPLFSTFFQSSVYSFSYSSSYIIASSAVFFLPSLPSNLFHM